MERSMKRNLTNVCATIIQPRSPFLFLGGSSGIFPYIGTLNLLLVYLVGVAWCRTKVQVELQVDIVMQAL